MDFLFRKLISASVAGMIAFAGVPAFAEDIDISVTATDAEQTDATSATDADDTSNDAADDANTSPEAATDTSTTPQNRETCADLLGVVRRNCVLKSQRTKLQKTRARMQVIRQTMRNRANEKFKETAKGVGEQRLQLRNKMQETKQTTRTNLRNRIEQLRNQRQTLTETTRTTRRAVKEHNMQRAKLLESRTVKPTIDETEATIEVETEASTEAEATESESEE